LSIILYSSENRHTWRGLPWNYETVIKELHFYFLEYFKKTFTTKSKTHLPAGRQEGSQKKFNSFLAASRVFVV